MTNKFTSTNVLDNWLEITGKMKAMESVQPRVPMPQMRSLRRLAELVAEEKGPELGNAFREMIEALVE